METTILELQEIRENAEAIIFSVDSLVSHLNHQIDRRKDEQHHKPQLDQTDLKQKSS
jgi:hypothetical protein